MIRSSRLSAPSVIHWTTALARNDFPYLEGVIPDEVVAFEINEQEKTLTTNGLCMTDSMYMCMTDSMCIILLSFALLTVFDYVKH